MNDEVNEKESSADKTPLEEAVVDGAPEEKSLKDETPAQEVTADKGEELKTRDSGPEWESDLDSYPLREATEDPRWAVRTVRIWAGIVLASLVFIITLLVLGAIYD